MPPSCGWNTATNPSGVVGSSPAGSTIIVTIRQPSWEQDCFSYGNGSESFVSYEVFPVTVQASPNTTVTFQVGKAVPTAAQIAEGIHNTTIWTLMNPSTVETDSAGVASANFTLAGAVMPFVANDISNVTLPIVASASAVTSTAVIPIEFTNGVSTILQSPGAIPFESGIGSGPGQGTGPTFDVTYSPSAGSAASPLDVTMTVVGTYDDGTVGPLPQDVQVSIPQPSFVLQPDSILYFQVDENNSLTNSELVSGPVQYTFAIQESVNDNFYTVPLNVTISQENLIFGGVAGTTSMSTSSGSTAVTNSVVPSDVSYIGTTSQTGQTSDLVLGVGAAIGVVVVVAGVGVALRSRSSAPASTAEPPA